MLKKRLIRVLLLTATDISVIVLSVLTGNFFWDFKYKLEVLLINIIISILIYLIITRINKIYLKIWEYATFKELLSILNVVTLSSIITLIVLSLIYNFSFIRILITEWMIQVIGIGMSRISWRLIKEYVKSRRNLYNRHSNCLIIGAGDMGITLAKQLMNTPHTKLRIVGFVDDDTRKQGREIYNIPVLGAIKTLSAVVKEKKVQHIIIAIPYIGQVDFNRILAECNRVHINPKIVPRIEELIDGIDVNHQLKDVAIDDLLGREPIQLDEVGIHNNIRNKTILITGAGGSIGSELCRQLIKYLPKKLILLGHGENSIYNIEMELLENYVHSDVEISTVIGDIQDREKIFLIIDKYHPDIIYHAAAHKHVPLMEKHPEEAIKNNILGTKNIAEAAHKYEVDTMVMVSTDKAVNPTNVMGASKRAAEMIVNSLNKRSGTKFTIVRFGNVLGSRGSVIPRFKKQILMGGPITVTDQKMIRYFMTIPEAGRLVIQASCFTQGGEIFILDMGEPVKIIDLAKKMIKLSGFSEEQIKIKISGIRPGEKLYEELLMNDEIRSNTSNDKIFIGTPMNIDYDEVIRKVDNICSAVDKHERVKEFLKEMVPTYQLENS